MNIEAAATMTIAKAPRLCIHCALARAPAFESRAGYSATIQAVRNGARVFLARTTLHNDGDDEQLIATIYSGWAIRSRTLDDGRRQVLRVLLPGDLIGAEAIFSAPADSSVEAITDVVLCAFPSQNMRKLFAVDSEIAGRLAAKLHEEVATGFDHLVNLGARSALERLAWFLLDLFERLRLRDMVDGDSCHMPLTQGTMGDALGLAPANVSRLMRELREMGLLEVRRGRLTLHDRDGLWALARRSNRVRQECPLF